MPDLSQVRLIAADMDHTLLTEASQLPPNFSALLARLQAADILFVPASGRPLYTLQEMFPNQPELAFVSDNGGVVTDRGELISSTLLEEADYQAMIREIQDHTDGVPLLCTVTGAIAETGQEELDDTFREFYRQLDYREALAAQIADVVKVTVYLPNGDSQRVYDDVLAPRFAADFSVSVSGSVWIDLMPKGVDKGHGLRAIGQHRGIPTAQMLAVGDNFNDAEMLQTAGFGYVVANANPAVRQFADYQTASNEEYGVSQLIEAVLAAQS